MIRFSSVPSRLYTYPDEGTQKLWADGAQLNNENNAILGDTWYVAKNVEQSYHGGRLRDVDVVVRGLWILLVAISTGCVSFPRTEFGRLRISPPPMRRGSIRGEESYERGGGL